MTATSAAHGYTLTTRYVTDPARDSVVMHTPAVGPRTPAGCRCTRASTRIVNGNGGGGSANGGADSGVGHRLRRPGRLRHLTPSARRPTATTPSRPHGAHRRPARAGLGRLRRHRLRRPHRASTPPTASRRTQCAGRPRRRDRGGHAPPRHEAFTLALGFGRTRTPAVSTARASLRRSFTATRARRTAATWTSYDARCAGRAASPARRPAPTGSAPTCCRPSVDKTFPGAIAAGLASPWGQAVSAGDLPGRQAGLLRLLPRGVRARPLRGRHRAALGRRRGDRARRDPLPVRAPAAAGRQHAAQLAAQRQDGARHRRRSSSTRRRTRS